MSEIQTRTDMEPFVWSSVKYQPHRLLRAGVGQGNRSWIWVAATPTDFDKQSLSQKNSKLWRIGPAQGQCVVGKACRDRAGAGLTFWHKILSCHLPSASAVAPGASQTLPRASVSPEWRSEGHRASRTDPPRCLIRCWQGKKKKPRVTQWPWALKRWHKDNWD